MGLGFQILGFRVLGFGVQVVVFGPKAKGGTRTEATDDEGRYLLCSQGLEPESQAINLRVWGLVI